MALAISLLAALFLHVALPKKDTARLAALLFWSVPFIVFAAMVDLETFAASPWVVPTFVLIAALLLCSAHLSGWRLAPNSAGLSAAGALQLLIYAFIASSLIAILFLHRTRFYAHSDDIYDWLIPLTILAILGVGGLHVVRARGKVRLAALFFWAVPLILLAIKITLHPIFDRELRGSLLALCAILLVSCLYLTQWQPAPRARAAWFDLAHRARILAATVAVASAIGYFGTKISAIPAENRLVSMLDNQLQSGEVAWLESELKRQ